jgi:hypothetical protein
MTFSAECGCDIIPHHLTRGLYTPNRLSNAKSDGGDKPDLSSLAILRAKFLFYFDKLG